MNAIIMYCVVIFFQTCVCDKLSRTLNENSNKSATENKHINVAGATTQGRKKSDDGFTAFFKSGILRVFRREIDSSRNLSAMGEDIWKQFMRAYTKSDKRISRKPSMKVTGDESDKSGYSEKYTVNITNAPKINTRIKVDRTTGSQRSQQNGVKLERIMERSARQAIRHVAVEHERRYGKWRNKRKRKRLKYARYKHKRRRVTLPKSDILPVESRPRNKRKRKKLYEYRGYRKENVKLSVDGKVQLGTRRQNIGDEDKNKHRNVDFAPMGGNPVGPIAIQEAFQKEYAGRFTDNAEENIPWEEPFILTNCWVQSMLSPRYAFSPSCNRDGTFSAKQCFLERCWCVNRNGKPRFTNLKKRFYYAMAGIMLKC